MKFTYAYRSKDGVRFEDVVCAPSRDTAYSILRAKGIKPIRVDLAPGFFNRLLSYGKRTWVIVILSVALLIAISYLVRQDDSNFCPMPRHHIYGDPVLLADFARNHYRDLVPTEGDAVLAHYSQPGTMPELGVTSGAAIKALQALAESGFQPEIDLSETENVSREAIELKRIVLWMRAEFRRYLSDGVGTPGSYYDRVVERQKREQQIYFVAQHDLSRTRDRAEFTRINKSLKSIGLPTITHPDDL